MTDFARLIALLKDGDKDVVIHDLNKRRRLFWSTEWCVLAQKTFSGSFSVNLYSGPDFSKALEAFTKDDTK